MHMSSSLIHPRTTTFASSIFVLSFFTILFQIWRFKKHALGRIAMVVIYSIAVTAWFALTVLTGLFIGVQYGSSEGFDRWTVIQLMQCFDM